MTLTRMIARPLLAAGFVVGGINGLRNSEMLAAKAKKVTDRVIPMAKKAAPKAPIPTNEQTIVRINAVTQIVAAGMLATGKFPRLSSTVLVASLVPTTIAGHAFWEEDDAASKNAQRLHFAKNLSMVGGLILAAVDTEGKPGVAWRARRAAKDVKREAARLGHDAGLETRLAVAKAR